MKTIKILTLILIVMIIGSLIWAITLPSEIHIKQSININAPIGVVYNEINDLHNWNNWTPWKDTSLASKYEGAVKGVGASVIWTDKKEGPSKLTITESKHFDFIKLEMTMPNKIDTAKLLFEFDTKGDEVTVTWSRDINELSYPFGRFVGWMLEKGYNHNFKQSLKNLKDFVETNKPTAEYYGYNIIESTYKGGSFLASNASSTMPEMKKVMENHFGTIMQFTSHQGLEIQGAPIVQWHSYNPDAESEFTCMVPVQIDSAIAAKNVYSINLPETKTVMIKYVGPYEGSYNAWVALDNYVSYNALIINGDPWEEYITDPSNEPDSTKWITNIYFPVK